MFRKIMLALVVIGFVSPATAQQARLSGLSEKDLVFAEAVRAYQTQLALDVDPDAHSRAVRDVLNEFDGRVIVEGHFGGEFCVMIWDAVIENVAVFRNNEVVPLDIYTDEQGRPAFATDSLEYDLSGWIDVRQDQLHLAVTMDGVAMRWADGIPTSPNGDTGSMLLVGLERVCKCGAGGISLCPKKEDCNESGTICTQPNGRQAQCTWQTHVENEPPNPHEFCMSAEVESLGGFVILATATFCPPVRRRLVRRVCGHR